MSLLADSQVVYTAAFRQELLELLDAEPDLAERRRLWSQIALLEERIADAVLAAARREAGAGLVASSRSKVFLMRRVA